MEGAKAAGVQGRPVYRALSSGKIARGLKKERVNKAAITFKQREQ